MKKIIFITATLFFVNNAFAGWPIGKGRSVVSLTYNWYQSKKYFDGRGNINDIGLPGDYFTAQFIALGFNYGLGRRTDFFVTLPILIQQSITAGTLYSRQGFGDATAGFTFHNESADYKQSLSVTLAGIFPMYSNSNQKLLLGYESLGAELLLNYSITPKFLKSGYIVLEGGVKQFFADDGPTQFVYNATIGSSLDKFNQLVFSVNGLSSLSINKEFSALNPNFNKDFTSIGASLSYGRRLTRTLSVYVTGNLTVWGVNTGKGGGLGASMVLRLP
jgi:hypothetical protein